MRKPLLILAGFAFVAALAAMGFLSLATAQECSGLPPTRFSLYGLTANDITPHAARRQDLNDAASPHPLMAMGYVIDGKIAIIHRVVAQQAGYCDAPERVMVGIGLIRRDVYIAPEASAVPCIRDALLAHEREHYRVVDAAIRAFLTEKQGALAQEIEAWETAPARDGDSSKQQFEVAVRQVLNRVHKELTTAIAGPLRQAVDSPAALATLHAACGGAVGVMEKEWRAHGLSTGVERLLHPPSDARSAQANLQNGR